MIHSVVTVRVGIEVIRNDSEWLPFTYRMFHCRSKDCGDDKHCSNSEWAADSISNWHSGEHLPGLLKLQIDQSARYWTQLRLTHHSDYWGEHDTEIEVLKCRRIK